MDSDSVAAAGSNRELLPFVLDDFPVYREVDVEVVCAKDVQGPGTRCGDRAVAANPEGKLIDAIPPPRPAGEFKADFESHTRLRYHVDPKMTMRPVFLEPGW